MLLLYFYGVTVFVKVEQGCNIFFIFKKCHAILSYLIGMQDVNLILRDTLKSFMNSNGFTDLLKGRWVYQRKIADAANGIQIEEKELDSVSH